MKYLMLLLTSYFKRATSKGLVCGGGLVIHLIEGEVVYANDSEVFRLSFCLLTNIDIETRAHSSPLARPYLDSRSMTI
jgi:hypothetical protein